MGKSQPRISKAILPEKFTNLKANHDLSENEMPDRIMAKHIDFKVIPTVCNLKKMLLN
jgi:hypothetical protein